MTVFPQEKDWMELDLGYVAEDLEKRGILKDGQDKKEDQDNHG